MLRVQAAYGEPGADETLVAGNLAEELRSMAAWLELDVVAVTSRGDLAPALRREGLARLDVEAAP